MSSSQTTLLVTVTGRDRPGVTSRLFTVLAAHELSVLDVEQVVIRGRLVLGVLLSCGPSPDLTAIHRQVSAVAADLGLEAEITTGSAEPARRRGSLHVTVLGRELAPAAIAAIAGRIAANGANIERITRLAHRPVTCIEFDISGADPAELRATLARESAERGVDVAVQRGGLHRRAMRLVVMDVDSTLVSGEAIDLLAARAGCEAKVAELTAATMRGELEFAAALRERVSLLAGLDAAVLDEVRAELRLAPGARTLIRTLRRLGYRCGIVSGGFTQFTDALAADLGLDYTAANTLEISGGKLTGQHHRTGHRPGGQGRGAARLRGRVRGSAEPDGGGRRRRQRPRHDRGRGPGDRVQRQASGQGRGGRLGERPVPGRGSAPARHLPRRGRDRRRRGRGAGRRTCRPVLTWPP